MSSGQPGHRLPEPGDRLRERVVQREVITAGPPAQGEGWRDGGGMEEAVEVEEKPLAGFFFPPTCSRSSVRNNADGELGGGILFLLSPRKGRAERRCGGVEVPGLLYIPRMSLLFSFQRR